MLPSPSDRGKAKEGTADCVTSILALDVRNAHAIVAAHGVAVPVVMARFAMLDRRLLDSVAPDCVMCPLFGPGFDAIQVIEALDAMGYQGAICVVTDPLPAPDVVLRELQAANRWRKGLKLIALTG